MNESEMKKVLGVQVYTMVRGSADDYLRFAKKKVTNRKVLVAVFACALRAALDELSPDERAAWLALGMAEVQRG